MHVENWMTPDPLTAGADVKLQAALSQMVRHRVRHLPVLEGGKFLGLLSAPVLLERLLGESEAVLEQAADQPLRAFLEPTQTLAPDDLVDQVLPRMETQACLPVVREGKLEGLFSHHNLLAYLQRQMLPGRIQRGGSTPTTHRHDTLPSLIRAVSTAGDLSEMMEMTARFLRDLMPLSQAFLLVQPEEAATHLKVAASFYASFQENKAKIEVIPIQDTLSGYVYTHRRSLKVDDLREEKRFPSSATLWVPEAAPTPSNEGESKSGETALEVERRRRSDAANGKSAEPLKPVPARDVFEGVELRSVIATPLMDQQRSFGVLHVWADRAYAYVDSDLELLELVSGYLSFLILRSWQLQKEKDLVQELQQANRIKDEFLAVVTHDLRNSIQGILALAQLLDRRISDQKLKELTRAIQDSVTHMSSLTRDLHDLAKLGMEAIRLNLSTCRLAATTKVVVEEFSEFARQQEVTLAPPEVDEELEVEADPVRIRQIISNLVSNAIKYNRRGGWVRLRTRRGRAGEIVLEVEDSGIGIAATEQKQVFHLFQQATNNRRLDGSGLGLAISQQLAELHGGHLELSSELGQGSTFRLILPIHSAEPAPASAPGLLSLGGPS